MIGANIDVASFELEKSMFWAKNRYEIKPARTKIMISNIKNFLVFMLFMDLNLSFRTTFFVVLELKWWDIYFLISRRNSRQEKYPCRILLLKLLQQPKLKGHLLQESAQHLQLIQ